MAELKVISGGTQTVIQAVPGSRLSDVLRAQGFDIIAGFFTSKKSANKCANQLKALGSDAYIISKSGGYYVSMGSAPTYTAAQAMEKHIKSWYKSDVSIKNFNE